VATTRRQPDRDRIHQTQVAFNTARAAGDAVEAAEYALELLRAHAVKAFSVHASVKVERDQGRATLTVSDVNGQYGPNHHRVGTLAERLGQPVLDMLPEGKFTLN
jgi:hypothetical protein